MKKLLSIMAIGLIAAGVHATSEEVDKTYFHPAASMYIHGNAAGASNLVANGLSLYPDDGKLKRLKELLDQQQEQEQNQDQQQDNQQNQDQQDQQDQQQDQEPQQDQEQNNQDQGEENEQESPPPEPQHAEQMTEDEAQQLLDAMRQDEQNKRLQLHPVMGAPVKVDKDW